MIKTIHFLPFNTCLKGFAEEKRPAFMSGWHLSRTPHCCCCNGSLRNLADRCWERGLITRGWWRWRHAPRHSISRKKHSAYALLKIGAGKKKLKSIVEGGGPLSEIASPDRPTTKLLAKDSQNQRAPCSCSSHAGSLLHAMINPPRDWGGMKEK